MKLVPPNAPYNPDKANLSGVRHGLSQAAFEIIQAFRLEVSEHDEDPGFDFDDSIAVIMKTNGFGRKLANHFMGAPNLPKDIEAIAHSLICNLGVLDDSRSGPYVEPGTQVTEDTPPEPVRVTATATAVPKPRKKKKG